MRAGCVCLLSDPKRSVGVGSLTDAAASLFLSTLSDLIEKLTHNGLLWEV